MTDPHQPDPWANPSSAPSTEVPPTPVAPSDATVTTPPIDPYTLPVQPTYDAPQVWADPTVVQPPTPFVSPDGSLGAPTYPATTAYPPPYVPGSSPVPTPPPPGLDGGYGAAAYPAPYQTSGYGAYGGYGTQPYYPYPVAVRKTNGMAVASLVLGILGVVLMICYGAGLVPGAIGAILGHIARRQIRTNSESGEGMALAGIITGWIATGVGLIVLALVIIFFVALASSTATTDFSY